MATGKIRNYPTVTLLATATTPNTEYTFLEPLTNFRNVRFVIDYSSIILNSIELDVTTVLNSGNVIVCFNDDNAVRKADVGSITATSMKTAGATNFKDISHLYVFGIK